MWFFYYFFTSSFSMAKGMIHDGYREAPVAAMTISIMYYSMHLEIQYNFMTCISDSIFLFFNGSVCKSWS
jgi:hypothetical protein